MFYRNSFLGGSVGHMDVKELGPKIFPYFLKRLVESGIWFYKLTHSLLLIRGLYVLCSVS